MSLPNALAQRMYAAAQTLADDAAAKADNPPADASDAARDALSWQAQAYGHTALMLQQMLSLAGQAG